MHLPIQDQEYYYPGRGVLLGLHQPGLAVRRTHVPFREAPIPPRKGKTSPRTRSRPELAWKLERKDRPAPSLAFTLRFCFSRIFLLLPGGPAAVAVWFLK